MSLFLTNVPGGDPGDSLSLSSDPGEFHSNWEETLWSGKSPENYNNDGLHFALLGSWTSMEEPGWTQDNPILRHDPFTMDLTEMTSVTDLPTQEPSKVAETQTEPNMSEPAMKRKVGRPPKTERRTVTALPTERVSDRAFKEARYRRMRDLNNIASSKCRLNR